MGDKLEMILTYVPEAEYYKTFDEAYDLALRRDAWAATAFENSAKAAGVEPKS